MEDIQLSKQKSTPAFKNSKKKFILTPLKSTSKLLKNTILNSTIANATKSAKNSNFGGSGDIKPKNPSIRQNAFNVPSFREIKHSLKKSVDEISQASNLSIIEISDDDLSFARYSLSDEVFPSPKRKLRSTFDKNEIIPEASFNRNSRTNTFNSQSLSDEVFTDEITYKNSRKKLRSTFDKNETSPIQHLKNKKLNKSFSENKDISVEITQKSPKKKLRSTFDKNDRKNSKQNKIDKVPIVLNRNKASTSEISLDSFNVNHSQSEDYLDNLNMNKRVSRKSNSRNIEEHRKSSRKRWSQSERTPVLGKLPPKSPLNMTNNQSVKFEQEKGAKSKKSVKIQSPLTPAQRKYEKTPKLIKKTPKPKCMNPNDSITNGNCTFVSSSISCMSMSPSSSSTPIVLKQNKSLLKNALKNTSLKGKMPDFAKIHERQYKKMENIQEMLARKAQRAQFLMSGSKTLASQQVKTAVELKKKLFDDDDNNDYNEKNKISKIPLPKKVSKVERKILLKKRDSLEKKKANLKSKVAQIMSPLPQVIQKPAITSKTLVPRKRVSLEKKKPVDSKPDDKIISRYGFKIPNNRASQTKNEQINAIYNKTKLITTNVSTRTEKNRNLTSTVRTNRRFELLMKMRANKK